MKILFISDIHGISTNLDYIDRKITDENIDKLVVLGDLYMGGHDREKINKFLEKHIDILLCTKGNCDSLYELMASNFFIIPDIGLINTDNIDIYFTHGDRYNMYDNKKIKNAVLIYGHEHIPYIEKDESKNMIYINTGSISKPRENNPCTYTIYNEKCFTIYDVSDNILFETNLGVKIYEK